MAEVKKQKKMPRKKATKRQKMDWFAAYVFIAPVTIGLFAFYIWPFFQNLWFSFNDVNKFNVSHFVGLENYKNILTDMTIWRSFGNTLKYVVITVPVGLFFSIVLAALLNAGIISKTLDGVKVLGNGELTKAVNVKVAAYTASAKEKIEKAGGKAEVM